MGGLVLAQLLQKNVSSNFKVIVFERDAGEDSRDQGYFITINSMGIDVLEQISAVENVLSDPSTMSYDQCQLKLVDKSMNTLFEMTSDKLKIVERGLLRRNLLKNIDVQWNKRFVSYEILDDGVQVRFDDGSVVQGSLLIGCDGARSLVRAQLMPDFRIEDTGIVRVSGTLERNSELIQIQNLLSNSLVQIYGDLGHTLFMISTGHLWLWSLSWPSSNTTEIEFTLEQILDKIRTHFHNEEFVRMIELSSSIRHQALRIYSSPVQKQNPYPNNPRVTLLGDAAHLMTPHRGMGANTAFADALDLTKIISTDLTVSALADYEEQLFKRGFQAVQDSIQSTQTAHVIGSQAQIRNYMLWSMHYIIRLKNLFLMPFSR